MNFPDESNGYEDVEEIDEEITEGLDETLDEESSIADDTAIDTPVKKSGHGTAFGVLAMAIALLLGGGAVFFAYLAADRADRALLKLEQTSKTAEENHAAMQEILKALNSIRNIEISGLQQQVARVSSSSRTQFSTLQRQVSELKNKLTSSSPEPRRRAPEPVPVVRSQPSPRTPTPAPGANEYVIQSGDTLGDVAKKYGLSVDQILKLNPKVDPRRLQIGQKVRLR